MKTELLLKHEKECSKYLDDISKKREDRPISEELRFILPR